MTAALTAVSIAAVAFAVLAFWLAWEHAEQAATVRALETALDGAEVERDLARVDLRKAQRLMDDWRLNAGLHKSLYKEQVEHTGLIAKGADDLAAELTTLKKSARCLPDLATQKRTYWAIEDAPIYAAVRAEGAA